MEFLGFMSSLNTYSLQNQLYQLENQLKGGYWHDDIQKLYVKDYDEIKFEYSKIDSILGTINRTINHLRSQPIGSHLDACKNIEERADSAYKQSSSILLDCVPVE